jgi:hypothetical protein
MDDWSLEKVCTSVKRMPLVLPDQIATLNKLKQKLRNVIATNLSLAPLFLRLAINDGVSYDAAVRHRFSHMIQFAMSANGLI